MQRINNIVKGILILIVLLFTYYSNSQNALEVFGKNKVQYNDDLFDWWIYETNNFVIYWYGKSRHPAQFCIEIAETENHQIQKLFEYHLKDKIELVIYADPSDLLQTNINLDGQINADSWDHEPKIKDQKILLYYNGDHEQLRNLLRTGITQLYFNSMFTGTALQDVVQKVISFRLPDWFEKGLIRYLANGWKQEDQIEFNAIWKQKNFRKTSNRYPEIAGQSFWNFLITSFGEQAISNWLYMTRIQKDIQVSAQLVFSISFQDLQNEWFNFYNNQLLTGESVNVSKDQYIKLKLKPEEKITGIIESHLQKEIILTTQQNGKYRVRAFNPEENSSQVVFKKESRTKLNKPNYTYPLYVEDPVQQIIFIIYEKRNRVYINSYDKHYKLLNSQHLPEEILGVYSAAYYTKNLLVFSANTNGYSDIIHYNLKTRQFKKITDDIWDDLDVKITIDNNTNKILYRSNKPNSFDKTNKMDSILPFGRFAIFSCTLDSKLNTINHNMVAEIPNKTIRNWTLYDSNYLMRIEEPEQFRWLLMRNDSTYEISSTLNTETISNSSKKGPIYYLVEKERKAYLGKINPDHWIENSIFNSSDKQENQDTIIYDMQKINAQDTQYFLSPFGNPPNLNELLSEFDKKSNKKAQTKFSTFSKYLKYDYPVNREFNSNQAIAYRNRFWIEELSSTANNDLLFSGLNTFSGTAQDFEPPPFGILLKTKITEVFENQSLEGGLRIPFSFDGIEAYLLYENRKKRFDHGIGVYFKTQTEITGMTNISSLKKQTNIYLLNYQLKYALDHYRSLKAISTIRNDHIVYLSTNKATLFDSSEHYQQRIGTRIEYIFDNALDISINIKNGWQAKIYFEFSKRFELNPIHKSKIYPGALLIAGFDARIHLPVLRKSVFSNRFYANSSFGKDRILYHVGGTENWLLPRYENQSALQSSGQYVYSALATEVRSYGYGARKAGSVFGWSSELRIPFLQYIISQNWKNSVLRNFQLITFFDFAYVWDGFFPDFKEESSLHYHAENPVIKIDLQYSRTPVITGTGFGLRTSLFGYFIRFDYAWNVDNTGLKNPSYNFSLGLDF